MTNRYEQTKEIKEEFEKLKKKFPDWSIIMFHKEDKVKDIIDKYFKNKQTKEMKK